MAKNKNTLSILCVKAEGSPVVAPFQAVQGKRNHLIICVPLMARNSSSRILP